MIIPELRGLNAYLLPFFPFVRTDVWQRLGSIIPHDHFICEEMSRDTRSTLHDFIFYGGQDPEKNAIESPGCRPLTYREFRDTIHSTVAILNAKGFHRNDRLAIVAPAGPETAVCITAVMAGFTSLPLNPQSTKKEFSDLFTRLGIRAIIVPRDFTTMAISVAKAQGIPVIELVPVTGTAGIFTLDPEAPKECGEPEYACPPDIAHVLLTSGTTAESKVIPVTQEQLCLSRERAGFFQRLTPDDRCLHIVPYYHGMGIGAALLSPLFTGGTVICTRDFIPSDLFSLIVTFQPTFYVAGPAIQRGILRELKKLPPAMLKNHSLRYIRSGSGFLPEDTRRDLESILNVPVIDAYGMSETGTVAINIPPKKGSVGIPFVESIRIIDECGPELIPTMTGEIIIRDAAVFSGYENAPDENTVAFINGWFRTGDLGYFDNEGYLFLTGRKKELINKGGEKISPSEIDAALISCPGVSEAMAFPIRDPVLGEDIAALVVRKQKDLTEAYLRRFLLDSLAPSKLPRAIFFVGSIPKTPSGKPMRYGAMQWYLRNGEGDTPQKDGW
jgi:oxalate---CoA ligase